MAKIDIIDDWGATEKTGTFTYADGRTVGYTYSSTGEIGDLAGATHDNNAVLGTSEYVSIVFDEPATGVTAIAGDLDTGEVQRFTVDGVVIDIDDWIAEGRIIVTGPNVSGDGTNLVNSNGDLSGGSNNTYNQLTFVDAVTTLRIEQVSGTYFTNSDILIEENAAPCFTAGTLIDTDQGPVPVETLQAGDMIRTKDHGFQPVQWVGESRIYASWFDVPLRIKAGTFGNTRDLVVSKRHKMLMDHTHLSLMFDVEEAFACAMHLRNDDTITREAEGWVTYYHVLLPQHEVIYAEGAATESFYPDEGTLAGMATATKNELLETFTPETYGPPARLTFDPMRAMWIGRNLDILQGDDMGQIAAYENAMKAAE